MKISQRLTKEKRSVSFKLFHKNQNEFLFTEMQNWKQVCLSIVQIHGLLISNEKGLSLLQRISYDFLSTVKDTDL